MPSQKPALERLIPSTTTILVVDVQERLSAVMSDARMADLLRAARILVEGGALLGARVLATEQYPKGLGPTIRPLGAMLDGVNAPRFPKLEFSACGDTALRGALADGAPANVVVLGMETHVCIFQTVRDLRASGYSVVLPVDGVVSRREDHREVGLALCERAGALLTTAETIAFDWLERAGTPEFKAISALVR